MNPRAGLVRNALRISFVEGGLATTVSSLIEPFLVPAVLALGASDLLVAAVPGAGLLMSGISHLMTPSATARMTTRKTMIVWLVRMQALAAALLACTGYLGKMGLPTAIASYAIYTACGSMTYASWASWMGDLVPRSGRGRYYGSRNMVFGLLGGAVIMSVGMLFKHIWGASSSQVPWTAFASLFVLAGCLRMTGSVLLRRQYEPPVAQHQRTPLRDFSYGQFLSKFRTGNFATFALLFAMLHGASSLTGPFFATYVLRDLEFTFAEYSLLQVVSIGSALFITRFWARLADRWGQMLVIRIAALILAAIPLLYILDGRMRWPLYLGWLLGGSVWAGLNLASFNLVTETATPQRRVRCFAYLQATIGISIAFTLFFWGAVAEYLPTIFQHRLQTVFLAGAILRFIPAFGLIFLVKERVLYPQPRVRDVLIELPAVRPLREIMRGWWNRA